MQVPLPTMPAGWLDTGVRCEREAEPGILPRFHLQERHPAGAIPGVSPSFSSFLMPASTHGFSVLLPGNLGTHAKISLHESDKQTGK